MPSKRLQQISSAVFSEIAAKKRSLQDRGQEMIDLSIGSPDLPPAPHIIERLRREVADPGNYGYAISASREFASAVSQWYHSRFQVDLNPHREVIGLLGSQEGLANICLALLDPGDLAIVPDPAYPIYQAGPLLAGAEVFPLPLKEENEFRPVLEDIPEEIALRAKVMILNFPSNPVAATVSESFFEEVVYFAQKYSILVIHDVAYSELAYDGYRPPSFLQVPGARKVGVEFNSLSKTYNMAGCRIGYAVGNSDLLRALGEIKGHVDYGPFKPIEAAAISALTGPQDYVKETVLTYQRRRDLLVTGLQSLGWPVTSPKATMFLWAKVPGNQDDQEFALSLMEKAGVCVVPGSGFGSCGKGYLRIALVQPEDVLEKAVKKIADSGLV